MNATGAFNLLRAPSPTAATGTFAARAHLVYLLLAIPSFLLLLFAYPNFHAPDDPDHFKRAYTLLEAPFEIVTPPGRSSGAMIDGGLFTYADEQYSVVMRPDWAPGGDAGSGPSPARDLRWGQPKVFNTMAGAVAYFPILYAPQGMAIAAGRSAGLTIDQTVFLARIVNGLSAILLMWLALYLLPQGHALVLAVLFLPRTMLQFASNSADPLLFALTLFILAVALRPALRRRLLAYAMSIAILVASAVRPPLGALAMVPFATGLVRRRLDLVVFPALAVLVAAAWAGWAQTRISDQRCPGQQGSPLEMIGDFGTHLPTLISNSFIEHGGYYYISLVAHYGYGNGPAGYVGAPLPWPVYAAAFLLLLWAIRLDSGQANSLRLPTRLLLVLATVVMTILTFFAIYVACSAVGSTVVAGVQGRYFVTMLFALAPALAGIVATRHAWPWRHYAVALSLWVVGCVTIMVTAAPELYRL